MLILNFKNGHVRAWENFAGKIFLFPIYKWRKLWYNVLKQMIRKVTLWGNL